MWPLSYKMTRRCGRCSEPRNNCPRIRRRNECTGSLRLKKWLCCIIMDRKITTLKYLRKTFYFPHLNLQASDTMRTSPCSKRLRTSSGRLNCNSSCRRHVSSDVLLICPGISLFKVTQQNSKRNRSWQACWSASILNCQRQSTCLLLTQRCVTMLCCTYLWAKSKYSRRSAVRHSWSASRFLDPMSCRYTKRARIRKSPTGKSDRSSSKTTDSSIRGPNGVMTFRGHSPQSRPMQITRLVSHNTWNEVGTNQFNAHLSMRLTVTRETQII